jgi:anaerobic C4-dicarboxylate transporter DcuA
VATGTNQQQDGGSRRRESAMSLAIVLQFAVVLAAITMGARYSGVGLGLWGAVGLLVLMLVFGVVPTSPPVDVILIILAVIMAASVMDAAGGIDFLVRVAEKIIRAIAALMLMVTRVNVDDVVKTATCPAGIVAVIGIFGLAWLGDSFISHNKDTVIGAVGDLAKTYPWAFAPVLFFVSVLLYSQAATTRANMPLGVALGIAPQDLIAMFPLVNGYFFIPTYGSLIAAINFDLSGTTKIGKYVLNHSFMIPGLVATIVAVATGLLISSLVG